MPCTWEDWHLGFLQLDLQQPLQLGHCALDLRSAGEGVVVDDFLGLKARNQCFLLGGVISKYGLDIRIKYVFHF